MSRTDVIVILLSAFFAAALAAFALAAEPVLQNSSFEDPVDAGLGYNWTSDRAVHWERWGGWFNRETSWKPVMDGQCMMAYHHWRIQGDEESGIYQDVGDVPAGKPYTFTVQVMKDKGANADYVEVRLESYLGGETLASKVLRMSDMKGGNWMPISVTGIPSKKGLRVLVITKPGRNSQRKGAIKFDKASLMEETNPELLATLSLGETNRTYGFMRRKDETNRAMLSTMTPEPTNKAYGLIRRK